MHGAQGQPVIFFLPHVSHLTLIEGVGDRVAKTLSSPQRDMTREQPLYRILRYTSKS